MGGIMLHVMREMHHGRIYKTALQETMEQQIHSKGGFYHVIPEYF